MNQPPDEVAYTLDLSDVADDKVRRRIAAPLIEYNEAKGGPRGSGFGRRLMAVAEEEAVRRGCRNAWLDTHEFQAPGFYEKLGYSVFGRLPDYPPGFARIFLTKRLVSQ